MSSSQAKITPVTTRDNAISEQLLTSFQDVLDAFKADDSFKMYILETPETHMASLSRDSLTKVLLAPELWNSFESRLPYLEKANVQGVSIIAFGSSEDFEQFPPEMKRPDIQQIALPISAANLNTFLQNVHNFQTMAEHSLAEQRQLEAASENIKHVMSISRELNGERDIPKLLNLILTKARTICKADAGSIYTIETPTDDIKDGTIRFRFTQNHSIEQNLSEFTMAVNEKSIVGNAAIHHTTINIPDLYELSSNAEENPFGAMHDRSWDRRIGYESHSMMTLPMFDISHNVIGVIQLINHKKDFDAKLLSSNEFAEQVIPFDEADEEYGEIVAQQAGIALENANMHNEIRNLFDGFVKASVTAIEQRDPTTSGHSQRVAHLTEETAKLVSESDNESFKDISFTDEELQECKYSGLLHDFGKINVPDTILTKSQKLYPEEFALVSQRFDTIRLTIEIDYLKKVINFMQAPNLFPMGVGLDSFEEEKNKHLQDLDKHYEFIVSSNKPTVLEQGSFELLKDIAALSYDDKNDEPRAFLTQKELSSLSVSRGSLTPEEFGVIESHVTHTYNFLRMIPWGKKLVRVPQIAAKHHEKLDGTGYPTGSSGDEIPIQSRIMAIADIFDALTASDRPYKKAVPVDKALKIIEMEVNGGKLDKDIYELFKESKVYESVLVKNFKMTATS